MVRPARLGKRLRDGLLAILGVLGLGFAAFLALQEPRERPVRLRMTAGQELGTRFWIAQAMEREASRRQITIDLKATEGSEEALDALDAGGLDVALVQGGLDRGAHPHLYEVAALHVEPLHLLVKEALYDSPARNLRGLRGKTVNLGKPRSGTYLLAREVMAFCDMQSGTDYTERTLSNEEMERETDPSRLPDAVFTVSSLLSPVAHLLVKTHHYRIMSLPFHEVFALGALEQEHLSGRTTSRIDRRHVYDATIPASAYEIEPGVPPEAIHTLGTRLLLVAREGLAATTIRRLVEVVFNSPFSKALPTPPDPRLLESPPELPWHDGTLEYVRRNSPLIAGDVLDQVEKQVSIVGVLVGGVFCLYQWVRRRYRWRRERSFEAYILQVAQVERRALDLSRAPTLDLAALLQLQEDLAGIKAEALDRFADGKLDGEELMSGFLAHASDARDFLMRLILHQRDNLEDYARAQSRPAEALWNEAVGELDGAV